MTQASRRVSPKTIEETYTDNDVERAITPDQYGLRPFTSYNTSVGFQFDYPMRWLNDKSDYKAIGIRRLKIIPSQHNINVTISFDLRWISVYFEDIIGYTKYMVDYCYTGDGTITVTLKILPSNSMDEILNTLVNAINDYLHNTKHYYRQRSVFKVPDGVDTETYADYVKVDYLEDESGGSTTAVEDAGIVPPYIYFDYSFNNLTGDLLFKFVGKSHRTENEGLWDNTVLENTIQAVIYEDTQKAEKEFAPTEFIFDSSRIGTNTSQLVSLLQFLNQDVTPSDIRNLTTPTFSKSFKEVWDREIVQVHASFSDNNRSFIGLNGDFYEKPSVLYEPPTNASNFSVYFTTDGHHRILLRHCKFFIGLCFIRNYNTSLATK